MNIDWAMLIEARDEWVAKNFPPYEGEVPGNDSILGCIEEAGELAHAHLKNKQGIRGTPEEHEAAAKDAIGDIVIYLLGVISAHMRPSDVTTVRTGRSSHNGDQSIFLLAYEIGLLSKPGNKSWNIGVNNVLKYCEQYCNLNYWNFDDIVMDTASHVFKRDWNRHRADGPMKDDPAMKDPRPLQGGGDPSVPFL